MKYNCHDCIFYEYGYCEFRRARLNLTREEMEEEYKNCGHAKHVNYHIG